MTRSERPSDSPQTTGAAGETLARFHAEWLPRVEAQLESAVPAADVPPQRLHEAMRYALFPGGKRLRPILALIGCEVTGGDHERALPAAAATELLHTYSLVHDDLPCMDDDDLRRGRATCHKVYGEAMAVLVGDALLTLAFEVVSAGGVEAVRSLAQAAGSRGMVGGQVVDLQSEGAPGSMELVQWIHDHKTAALIRGSLLVGAHAGGGDLSTLDALGEFGALVGRAFQIADDCLDRTGSAQNLGKRPGQDEAASKLTYPAVMGVSASLDAAQQLVRQAEQRVAAVCSWRSEPLESARQLLRDVARFTVSRGS